MRTTAKRLTKPEMRALVEGFAEALNAHDLQAVASRLTDDVVWTHPFTVEPLQGKAAVMADLAATYRSFPDLHAPLEDAVVYLADDHAGAVMTWTMVGTMTGESPFDYAPRGKVMRIRGMGRFGFRDGLIASYEMVYDGLDFARQLGIMPGEKSLTLKALIELQRWTTKARKAMRLK